MKEVNKMLILFCVCGIVFFIAAFCVYTMPDMGTHYNSTQCIKK